MDFYKEIHKLDPLPIDRTKLPKVSYPAKEEAEKKTPASIAKRTDNKSGQTGVSFIRGQWEARICYQKVRYILGKFDDKEPAIAARKQAERELAEDHDAFIVKYRDCQKFILKKGG